MRPRVARRFEVEDDPDVIEPLFTMMQTFPESSWTDAMLDQVKRAITDNEIVAESELTGGRSVPEAARELLIKLRPSVPLPASDDDIPF